MSDIGVSQDGFVATVEMRRPPHNFFDSELIAEIGEAFQRLDADPGCRAIVLAAEGRSFCAGADFSRRMETGTVAEGSRSGAGRHLYKEAIRLFRTRKPVVAAVHGAAVGGGLGLALVADFRVTCDEARFSANFNRLGFHPGFGLTATLPRLVGAQQAALLPAIVVERYLRRLRRAGCDPFDKTVTAPDPLQSWRFAAAALFNRF